MGLGFWARWRCGLLEGGSGRGSGGGGGGGGLGGDGGIEVWVGVLGMRLGLWGRGLLMIGIGDVDEGFMMGEALGIDETKMMMVEERSGHCKE